jgi:hypothetical protein
MYSTSETIGRDRINRAGTKRGTFFYLVILAQPIPVFQKRETLAAIQTGRDPRLQNSNQS